MRLNINHRDQFVAELSAAINRASVDSLLNTPDFILAELLEDTLSAYNEAKTRTEQWHCSAAGAAPQDAP